MAAVEYTNGSTTEQKLRLACYIAVRGHSTELTPSALMLVQQMSEHLFKWVRDG